MRLGQRVKGFFSRIGKGIKKGAQWAYNTGRKVIGKVREYAPKVIDTAKRVLNVLPSNKYTNIAKDVVNKGEGVYKKFDNGVKRAENVYNAGKRALSGSGS